MSDHEIALRAALNLLRDSIECGRMPSGLPLTPDAVALHEDAVRHLEMMLGVLDAMDVNTWAMTEGP